MPDVRDTFQVPITLFSAVASECLLKLLKVLQMASQSVCASNMVYLILKNDLPDPLQHFGMATAKTADCAIFKFGFLLSHWLPKARNTVSLVGYGTPYHTIAIEYLLQSYTEIFRDCAKFKLCMHVSIAIFFQYIVKWRNY